MRISPSPAESAMMGPSFGSAIAVEGFGKRYHDPRRHWNLGAFIVLGQSVACQATGT